MRRWNWIPDEWATASQSALNLYQNARQARAFALKQVVAFASPLAVGVGCWLLLPTGWGGTAFVQGVLIFSGVLAGFVLSLMLFTGQSIDGQWLTLEEANRYREKVRQILWTQMLTLAILLVQLLLCLAWLATSAAGAAGPAAYIHVAIAWFLWIPILRVFLLPPQIIELHEFSLLALVRGKEREVRDRLNRLHEEERAREGIHQRL